MSTLRDRRNAARRRHRLRLAWLFLCALCTEWRRRARSRAALAQLSPHLLRDIGISPAERLSECR
ncbi:MAG TPA: DUF1127 domain-containing protein, partial [Stellaceae bacterium]|nr:DUF1127 domain-containing protein [Stellaceae bacterium]